VFPVAELGAASLSHHEQDAAITRGELHYGTEVIPFTVQRVLPRPEPPPPMVLLVPILAGGQELMDLVATRLLARGFDVASCARAGSAMRPPQRGPELDELFRRTVLHQRVLLRHLRQLPTPPRATCVLGISLGGMVATALAAVDPELSAAAIVVSGGDVANLVTVSSEPRVQTWRTWRRETDGVGDDCLGDELRQRLHHEPIRLARAVPTAKVLFVGGTLDSVIPPRHQDLLWEALGRPRRVDLPLGHYTAALAIDGVVAAAASHFATAIAAPAAR
jgi:pimeloyl-ACP methyl ester carboxylesterase